MEYIEDKVIVEPEKINKYLPLIESSINKIEQSIMEKIDNNGLLNYKFESRLLETILMASYFKYYHQNSQEWPIISETLEKVFSRVVQSEHITPGLDLNIQRLLYELFTQQYDKSFHHLQYWYSQYQVLLNEAFKEDLEQNRMKKILLFDLIAVFCCSNKQHQRELLKIVISDFVNILPFFQASFKKEEKSHWNQVYSLLFQLIILKFGSSNYVECLTRLMSLQSEDGTWFQNHTLTLLILHSIRLHYHDIVDDVICEGMRKAEFYLQNYLKYGMSIIISMNIFNTALFFSQREYFSKKETPNAFIDFLSFYQKKDGGWTSDLSLRFTDWDTSGFALLTLIHRWNKTKDPKLEPYLIQAMNYLFLAAQYDGSFAVYVDGTETLAEMTARGIMALSWIPPEFIIGNDRFNMLYQSFSWLEGKQHSNGLYYDQSYSSSKIYPLSQIALAIKYVEDSPYLNDNQKSILLSIASKIRERIIKYLQTAQNPNGSYSSRSHFPLHGEQQSTAYAIMALALLIPGSKTHLRALKYLLNTISFPVKSFPEGTGPRPIRYNDLAHGPIFVYLALIFSKVMLLKLQED